MPAENTLKPVHHVSFADNITYSDKPEPIKPILNNNAFKPFNSLYTIQSSHEGNEGLRAHSRMQTIHYKSKLVAKTTENALVETLRVEQKVIIDDAEHNSDLDRNSESSVTEINVKSDVTVLESDVLFDEPAERCCTPSVACETREQATPSSHLSVNEKKIKPHLTLLQIEQKRPWNWEGPWPSSTLTNSQKSPKLINRAIRPQSAPLATDKRNSFVVPSHNSLDDWFTVSKKMKELPSASPTKAWIHEPRKSISDKCDYGKPSSPNSGHAYWREVSSMLHGTTKLEKVKEGFTFTKPPSCYGDMRCRRQADVLPSNEILVQHYQRLEQYLERDKRVKQDPEYELAIQKEMFCTLVALDGNKPSLRQAIALLNLSKYWLRMSKRQKAEQVAQKALSLLEELISEQTIKTANLIRPLRASPVGKVKVYETQKDTMKKLCELEAKLKLWLSSNFTYIRC